MTIEIILKNQIINIDDSLSFDFSQAIYPRGLKGDKGDAGDDYILTEQDKREIADMATPDISGKADKVQNATTGNFASLDANGNLTDSGHKHSDYLTEAPVTDVQIAGTSVLGQDGTANIPLALWPDPGVVKVSGDYGIGRTNNGALRTASPTNALIKEGTNQYRPIVPSIQHESTFYGLAKAAGDTTQSSSSNSVGTYTDDAKIKIQKMLGIYEAPWELIREDTFTNETEADHTITVDGNGDSFNLTDVILLFELPNVAEASSKTDDRFTFRFYATGAGNKDITMSGGTMSRNANGNAVGTWQVIEQKDGMLFAQQGQKATTTNSCAVSYRYHATNPAGNGIYLVPEVPFYCNKITIPSVTGTGHYKLFGKRRWT